MEKRQSQDMSRHEHPVHRGHRAKKSLGQNFLKSKRALNLIAEAAQLSPKDIVLEIGPGKGVLTRVLLEKAGHVIAVEKDDMLVPFLHDLFAREIAAGKFTLIHGDILEMEVGQKTDTDAMSHLKLPTQYKLVANIPYYITGALLRMFLESDTPPQCMVLMLQKEVAQRIIARDKKESLLSISVKAYGIPKYIETVKAMHFSPKPNVDSAILLIDNISKPSFNQKTFFEVLKAGFAHKRKLLARNLESSFDREKITEAFAQSGIADKARAEDITLEQWRNLASAL